MFGSLTTEERRPCFCARPCNRLDDATISLGGEAAHCQVVRESQWPGADGGEIVDTHRDQVVAEQIELAGSSVQIELGPDAVGAHHDDGIGYVGGELDAGCESAEPSQYLVGPGCSHRRTDGIHESIRRLQVDAGLSVGGHQQRSSANLSGSSGRDVG